MIQENQKYALCKQMRIKAKEIKADPSFTLAWAYRSPATPWYAKVFAAMIVAYAFSPIDLMPDFIPVLGYLDNVILVPRGITLAIKMIPEEVLAEARVQAKEAFQDNKQRSGYLARSS